MKNILSKAISELWRNPGQTLLTIAGYTIAGALFLVLFVLAANTKNSVETAMQNMGANVLAMRPGCGRINCSVKLRDHSEMLTINGIQTIILPSRVVKNIQKKQSVKDASLFISFRFRDSTAGRFFTIGGFDPSNTCAVNTTFCGAADIIEGRPLTPDDTNAVILHRHYARLYRVGVGDTVVVAGEQLKVIGIINPGVRLARADMYMNITRARPLVQKRLYEPDISQHGNAILIESESAKLHQETIDTLINGGFEISYHSGYKPAAQITGLTKRTMWLLNTIFAFGIVLLCVQIQLASVIRKWSEIDILRSTGWSTASVIQRILLESILQACIGWFLGCILAMIVLAGIPQRWICSTASESTALFPVPALLSLALVLLGGSIAALLVAVRAEPLKQYRPLSSEKSDPEQDHNL